MDACWRTQNRSRCVSTEALMSMAELESCVSLAWSFLALARLGLFAWVAVEGLWMLLFVLRRVRR